MTSCTDHPRVCGENPRRLAPLKSARGSPPRMRGKLASRLLAPACVRITPAHAGKTWRNFRFVLRCSDHPRACGENCLALFNSTHDSGSPPRMRGKPEVVIKFGMHIRITPAHAGKTAFFGNIQRATNGSPPRMRGKLLLLCPKQ